ncbi:MAG TPA: hypothetical protein PLZ51_18165, partial [Aggregatilineales bacterium]|nr:hypothetical protein [Aggregatilineales bacterium]
MTLKRLIQFTPFDMVVWAICAILTLIIGLSVAFGIPEDVLRVAYLHIDDKGMYQIFATDPNDLANKRQLTTSPKGVYDFDTSPDGRTIVFTERDPETFH